MNIFQTEQCVMITGPFGSGKSMTVFYVALRLEDVDGFDIMIVSDLDDIIKYKPYVCPHFDEIFKVVRTNFCDRRTDRTKTICLPQKWG
jgi:ABC-type polar amino acid transport system ATPase subunit